MEITGPTEDLDGNVPNPVDADSGQMANAKENMGETAILPQSALHDIGARLPISVEQLQEVDNMGEIKARKYPPHHVNCRIFDIDYVFRNARFNIYIIFDYI